jgi:hypothetical protein
VLVKVDISPALQRGVTLTRPVYLWGKVRASGTTVPGRSLKQMDHRAVKSYMRRGIFAVKVLKPDAAEAV